MEIFFRFDMKCNGISKTTFKKTTSNFKRMLSGLCITVEFGTTRNVADFPPIQTNNLTLCFDQ